MILGRALRCCCCHHPASEMLGMLIKTRKLHPIVTNTDYNCYMYYRHRLQAKMKGWTTEIFHADCLQLRVEGPWSQKQLFVSSEHLQKCANVSTVVLQYSYDSNSTHRYFCSQKMRVRFILLFVSYDCSSDLNLIDIFWRGRWPFWGLATPPQIWKILIGLGL